MTIREKLTLLDSEGAVVPPPNPLRTFALRIAEATLITYDEVIKYEPLLATPALLAAPASAYLDHCRAKALREVDESLESYGIVAAYPDLLAVVKAIAAWYEPGETTLRADLATAAKTALALAEQSLLPDIAEGAGSPTPEDVPL